MLQSEQLCGFQAAMSGDDRVVSVDEDRIGEAESGDAAGNLPDLLFGMSAGIARRRATAIGSMAVGFISVSLRDDDKGAGVAAGLAVENRYRCGQASPGEDGRRRKKTADAARCGMAGSSTPALYSFCHGNSPRQEEECIRLNNAHDTAGFLQSAHPLSR